MTNVLFPQLHHAIPINTTIIPGGWSFETTPSNKKVLSYPNGSAKAKSAPIFRFRNKSRNLPALAYDTDGHVFELYDGVDEGLKSFYDEELGKPLQTPRNTIAPTPPVPLEDHRIYNVSHLRIVQAVERFMIDPRMQSVSFEEFFESISKYEGNISAPTTKGGVTLTYFLEPCPTMDSSSLVKVTYGTSICSFEDRYDRRAGLVQALARLQTETESPSSKCGMLSGTFKMNIHPSHLYNVGDNKSIIKAPWFPTGKKIQFHILDNAIEQYLNQPQRNQQRKFSVLTNVQISLVAELTASGHKVTGLDVERAD